MRDFFSLKGKWRVLLSDGSLYEAELPGTLDTNNIGYADKPVSKLYQDENYVENKALSAGDVIATRFTRNHTYEGKAVFSRSFDRDVPEGRRLFLKAERARVLYLFIDEKEIPSISGSLSTPYAFEVTGLLHKGSVIEIISDNSYENLPHDNIVYSSAATDETQTNWNGILGEFGVEVCSETFIESIRVYPIKDKNKDGWKLEVIAFLNSDRDFEGELTLDFEELGIKKAVPVKLKAGITCASAFVLAKVSDDLLWDEYEGRLNHLRAGLLESNETSKADEIEVSFGIKSFENIDGHLCLNGRRIFLRSEANCAVFPETGHPPVNVSDWKKVIETYMGYGVNCLRFHSHCPPKAAFDAADELGVLMQPELSHWNPENAFSEDLAAAYYGKELSEILKVYANHPSFVMLTFGNELQAGEDGMKVVHELLDMCHNTDKTRLFAFSSNAFYGEKGADEKSDFYTAMRFRGLPMRATFDGMKGFLNSDYPDGKHDYSDTVKEIRKEYRGPVFSFEVGQFEVLPDFDEIEDFNGVTSPKNYQLIKKNVLAKGYMDDWKKRVEATGELSLLGYREEVEAALRTREYSGISLLGIQDFPGQGTALVGMLDSHLEPKPYSFADPKRFRSFFTDVLPLVYLDKYTYVEGEELRAEVKVINYSKNDIKGKLHYKVSLSKEANRKDGLNTCEDNEEAMGMSMEKCQTLCTGSCDEETVCKKGDLTSVGEIVVDIKSLKLSQNARLYLTAGFAGFENTYPIWVYGKESQNPSKADNIYETKTLDENARKVLQEGGIVFFAPDSTKESLPNSIKSTFTTDFWSVGTFASQEGSMGLLIDNEHPLFKDYPTSFHTDYQWFMTSSQRALILPDGVKSIVTVMDSYAYLRNMGMLLEFNCLKGRVFISTLGLDKLITHPECAALLTSIYDYLSSADFKPSQHISYEKLLAIIGK